MTGTIRKLIITMCAGFLGVAGLVGLAPTAAADACANVAVVFARGTNEPAGVGRVGQAFVDSLRNDLNGQSMTVSAVNYPADYDFLQAAQGANDASAQIQTIAAQCPDTRIVLGGFSQGAAVADFVIGAPGPIFGYTNLLPQQAADHVAAVALFGNPSNKIGKPIAVLSPAFAPRTIDLCNGADPVCSPGDDRAAHSQYVEAGMTAQAATFVANQLAHPAAPAPADATLAVNVAPAP